MFTVRGRLDDGRMAAATWKAGRLIPDDSLPGSQFLVGLVEGLRDAGATMSATPTGPVVYTAADGGDAPGTWTLLALVQSLDEAEVSGRPPRIRYDLPRGATP